VTQNLLTYLYLLPVAAIIVWYMRRHNRLERESLHALKVATEAGMLEPPTLHPEIDPTVCIGCKSCVVACPRHAIRLDKKRGIIIDRAKCQACGTCTDECPSTALKKFGESWSNLFGGKKE